MLKVDTLNAEDYLKYVSMGASAVSTKSKPLSLLPITVWDGRLIDSLVKNDTFRTLATDTQFKGKVKEDMLIRLLEAFVWKNHGELHGPYKRPTSS